MGFRVWQLEADVRIPASVHDQALEAIKSLHRGRTLGSDSTCVLRYEWVDSQEVLDAESLGAALAAWRWPATFDEAGNIVNLRFSGQKAGDDEMLLEALAPFAGKGSYIVIEDEDGAIRRWYFEDGECRVALLKAMDTDTSWRDTEPS